MTTSRWVLAAFGVLALGACTNEKIVFRTREPFNPPPDSVNGFLGYFDLSTKQTTCGNCHVSTQGEWVNTKHADAWADLQASGHASPSCSACHSVSELGNSVGHPAGYSVNADSVYHDVQCENCHGPGFTHVQSPTAQNRPLASIEADTGTANGCGGCHTGIHEPFVDQWVQSAHGSGDALSHTAGNASCEPCHEGRAALLVKFGVTANYVEKGGPTPEHIVCAVCHDPHGSPYSGQLRASISEPTTANLCITCHSRKGTPPWGTATATSAARGSHGAQGLLVLGDNVGWIPPGFTYDTNLIVSSHGTAANPRLCATCHVAFTTITDSNGVLIENSVGHLFEAVPCTNATTGVPEPCTPARDSLKYRDFSACATSQCHIGGQNVARGAYQSLILDLDNKLDQIWFDTNGNAIIDSTDGGLIPQLVARAQRAGATAADSAEIDFGNSTTTVAKGTLFNASLAATSDRQYFLGGTVLGKGFAAHAASGNGVHNPFLIKALLDASIASLHSTYGLVLPPRYASMRRTTPPSGLRRTKQTE